MGYLGNPAAVEVQAAVEDALKQIISRGKATVILTSDRGLAQRYLDLGARFVAVGSDVGLLSAGTAELRAAFTAAALSAKLTGY
ncbi:hypothetical protein [Cypionkella sp. TWP1-2-1b2]|uniref:hypothetical protein n=1 Tax=Cypionkella sp. TWP1-2-1b2 TaxID=2804675 RepID=UPI003CE9E1EC